MSTSQPARGRPRNFDKTEVLTKAMRLFWEKGYEGTSMAELTAEMGVGAPSLYAAFGSKEDLFNQAIDLYRETDGATVWQATLAAPTAFESVQAFLMTSAHEFSCEDRPSGCLINLSALQLATSSPTIRDKLSHLRVANIKRLANQLSKGVELGEIPPSVDVKNIARYFVTVQQGMSVQARDGASRNTLKSIAETALATWPALIAKKKAEPHR